MTQNTDPQMENPFDLGVLVKEIKKRWFYYGVSLFFICSAAFLYNKLAIKQYKIFSTVLINIREEVRQESDYLSSNSLSYFGNSRSFTNELLAFGSSPLVKEAIQSLDWKVSMYEKELLGYKNIYSISPFKILIDEENIQAINIKFQIIFIDENTCRIIAEGDDVQLYNYKKLTNAGKIPHLKIDEKVRIGQKVENKYISFIVLYNDKNKSPDIITKDYAFELNSLNQLSARTKGQLTVSPYDHESSVLNIEFVHSNPRWATMFIEALTHKYMELNLEKKNHVAQQTINYIDSQIGIIQDSLNMSESELQNYRMTYHIIDLETQSRTAQEQLRNLENDKAALESRMEYYNYLNEYFNKEAGQVTDLIAPSAMGIEDPLLTGLIQDLLSYSSEMVTLEYKNQQRNPRYQTLEIRIENLNKTIRENLQNIITTSNLSLSSIEDRISTLRSEIQKLPRRTRELTGLERKFNVNNEIFTYLLQRRAESEIAKASSLPDNEIIEPATVVGIASPKSTFIYALAVLFGLLLPSIPVLSAVFFNKLIMNKKDLNVNSEIPVLGTVYHYQGVDNNVFKEGPSTDVAESFRSVRTNLDFMVRPLENKVLLVTSCFSQEGKSFFTLNLAYALAGSDKRVVIVDFDLRKPTLHYKTGYNNVIGVSNYLINQANLDDIIIRSDIPGLDFVFCGEIPPNPNELIASDKTQELIEILSEDYEYILLDSPPIGLVTDASYLINIAQKAIFITRQGETHIDVFKQTINELNAKFPRKIMTVLNDYKHANASADTYAYKAYAQTYKRYFDDDSKKKRWFRKKRAEV